MKYKKFIDAKLIESDNAGFTPDESIYPELIFPHQKACVTWACKRGRAAFFWDTGLGKTLGLLTWASQVHRKTCGVVLILCPLAVTAQTLRESVRFGIDAHRVESSDDISMPGIYITNYEKLHHFDSVEFNGVVIDESSILKGFNGKLRKYITDRFSNTPYRLSCTATPSPNDYMELGTQSEFLGIMSQTEMLSMFFIHDGGETSKWRLKGHGMIRFWEWLSSWAIFLKSPSDLGFDSSGYDLPPIKYHNHTIEVAPTDGLFATIAQSLTERNSARRESITERCIKAAEIGNSINEQVVFWCYLNAESKLLTSLINGAVEIKGSDTPLHKESSLLGFTDGSIKKIVSKPKIAGFGMNWQSSHHCVFVGLSDSWEAFYQAIRRQWRFGQTKIVHVHIISAETEGAVVENIRRKEKQHNELSAAMMNHMRHLLQRNVLGATIEKTDYSPTVDLVLPDFLAMNSKNTVSVTVHKENTKHYGINVQCRY